MTKISLYPNDTNIEDDDILLGTDKETPGDVTKNFPIGSLKAYITNSLIFKNLTPIPLSASALNFSYPNAVIGTQVICSSLEGSVLVNKVYVYTCTDAQSWALDVRDKVV
jgi:hypothetical protein